MTGSTAKVAPSPAEGLHAGVLPPPYDVPGISPIPTKRVSMYDDDSGEKIARRETINLDNDDDIKRLISAAESIQDLHASTAPMFVQRFYALTTSPRYTYIAAVIVLYALFGDDVRLAFFPPSSDLTFSVLATFSLLFFLFEFVILSWMNHERKYVWSFAFWLDLIATITMIPDITVFWDLIILGIDTQQVDYIQSSRLGSRSARIVKIVRLVRLVRVAKLYGISMQKRLGADHHHNPGNEMEPSRVSNKLNERTMQRVIMIILIMLVALPFFDSDFYLGRSDESGDKFIVGLNQLHRMPQDQNVSVTRFEYSIQEYVRTTGFLLYLEICSAGSECMRYNVEDGGEAVLPEAFGVASQWSKLAIRDIARETVYWDEQSQTFLNRDPLNTFKQVDPYLPNDVLSKYSDGNVSILEDRRLVELIVITTRTCYGPNGQPREGYCRSIAYFDDKYLSKFSATINILRTLFVMMVLTIFGFLFWRDAETIVLRPIERMVAGVRALAENPMATVHFNRPQDSRFPDDETLLLERTIGRVTKLLQIGFGEAGARIIAKNMSKNQGNSREIDLGIEGHKINAIFGFCDIRNFTDTTECLQEKVMVYVNKVGKIVHEATHLYHGAANKNIGDAFLLVWRLEDKRSPTGIPVVFGNMCDNALIAFLKSLVDLKIANMPGGSLYAYQNNRLILKRFGEGFEIRLGMGLHVGWAIEGAIGSRHKIDASYLSPNVNMAARLEAATKQFGTPLLLSEDFYDGLSHGARSKCRLIDKVTVKGSIQPMALYTFDIADYIPGFATAQYDDEGNRMPFDYNELTSLQTSMHKDFLHVFQKGVNAYLEGEWETSKTFLLRSLDMKENDGPAKSLLRVLEAHDYKAPEDWKGYRELTEK